MNSFSVPDNLSIQGKAAVEVIVKRLRADISDLIDQGYNVFVSPNEWKDRGEQYGLKGELVIIHDGGDLARYFSYDCEDYPAVQRMNDDLGKVGLYAEQCTRWYSAVYKL